MLLYHGTTEEIARAALTEGIPPCPKPTDEDEEDVPISLCSTRLTTAYAGHFAMLASGEDERCGIIEVDTDKLDEMAMFIGGGFLRQPANHLRSSIDKLSLVEVNMRKRVNAREHQKGYCPEFQVFNWKDSIELVGLMEYCAPVEATAITRVSIFNPRANQLVASAMGLSSSTFTNSNHQERGDRLCAITRWLMGESITLREFYGDIVWDVLESLAPWNDFIASSSTRVLDNFKGLELVL